MQWMLLSAPAGFGVVMFPAVDPPSVGGGGGGAAQQWHERETALPFGKGIQVWSLKRI